MKLKTLLTEVPDANLTGDGNVEIQGVACASGAVQPGFLFAALRGQKTDGNRYVADALRRGAAAVLSEAPLPPDFPETWVQVADARRALGLLSAQFYGRPSDKMDVIGITGTNGKTTVSFLLEKLFAACGHTPGVLGTIVSRCRGYEEPSRLTTPEAPDIQRILSIMLAHGVTHCFMEVSSHALELHRVAGVRFRAAVFTNLTGDHLDFHGTMENYFAAKKKLFAPETCGFAAVNADDPWGRRLLEEVAVEALTYGIDAPADIRARNCTFSDAGIRCEVATPSGTFALRSPLLGKPNLYNMLAAVAVAVHYGLPLSGIRGALAGGVVIPGRMERIPSATGIHVVVDFAHTDDALRGLLETVRPLSRGRVIVVFGAGGDRDRSKRPRMGRVAARLSDLTVLTSDNPRSEDPARIIADIEKGLRDAGPAEYLVEPDRREAIRRAIDLARPGDWVVIAGKGHENYQIIGDRFLPFSDQEVARQVLRSKEKGKETDR